MMAGWWSPEPPLGEPDVRCVSPLEQRNSWKARAVPRANGPISAAQVAALLRCPPSRCHHPPTTAWSAPWAMHRAPQRPTPALLPLSAAHAAPTNRSSGSWGGRLNTFHPLETSLTLKGRKGTRITTFAKIRFPFTGTFDAGKNLIRQRRMPRTRRWRRPTTPWFLPPTAQTSPGAPRP